MLHMVIERNPNGSRQLAKLELDVLELFGQFSKALGYPKSVGEIYGILYLAEGSLSMGEIVERLNLSLGSVSQGLKTLKSLDAISVSHSDTSRRDMFIAKTDFGQFLSCFLKDRVQPGIQTLRQSIETIRQRAAQDLGAAPTVARRIDGIQVIHALLGEIVPAVSVVLEEQR